ncbi:MAG TPA: CDP-diacylglycerol--serine O-phosphatidyltransferase [Candidatus Binatia bacterium]|nr:CDP-diacylglycerol--serine O-phosphatidyltransferase [Candidatus Binatia bacterium]
MKERTGETRRASEPGGKAAPETANRAETCQTDAKLKIYFLPNLMTAGNLFCGFVALTKIVQADLTDNNFTDIRVALLFILLACIFDLFDGRLARMGGQESPFGREFDSLADIISFGVAPAFLVHRIVLRDVFAPLPQVGWFIASIYLVCGAWRLARFNCLAAQAGTGGGKDFLGFPIPAAAGMVASLTWLLMWMGDHGWLDERFNKTPWRFALPIILVFLSLMMVSEVKYPTFKTFDLKATRTFTKTLVAVLLIGSIVIFQEKMLILVLPLFFTAYLIYGFIRPHVSRRIRREIEDRDDDDLDDDDAV